MRRSRRSGADDGSASLEFITAGMILLVPLLYLILAMSAIQGGTFAVTGAARQAARVYVESASSGEALAATDRAIGDALADYGISREDARVSVACAPRPTDCLTRRGFVTVTVRATIALPLVPAALGADGPLAVPVTASATQQVSRFWGSG